MATQTSCSGAIGNDRTRLPVAASSAFANAAAAAAKPSIVTIRNPAAPAWQTRTR